MIHRGFLITGLPPDAATGNLTERQLRTLGAEILRLAAAGDASLSSPWSFKVKADRTVHRTIRNGAACIIVSTGEQAAVFWESVCRSFRGIHSDGGGHCDDCGGVSTATYAVPPIELVLRGNGNAATGTTVAVGDANKKKVQQLVLLLQELRISRSAGKIRDHLFSTMRYGARSALRLDPTATFSTTDSGAARRMALIAQALLCGFSHNNNNNNHALPSFRGRNANTNTVKVLDAFACCGGNALGFLSLLVQKQQQQDGCFCIWQGALHVTAVELDSNRADMLRHNLGLLAASNVTTTTATTTATTAGQKRTDAAARSIADCFTVRNQCAMEYLAQCQPGEFDVVFLDPPWGGPQYGRGPKAKSSSSEEVDPQQQTLGCFPPFTVSLTTALALGLPTTAALAPSLLDSDNRQREQRVVEVDFADLVRSLVFGTAAELCRVVMLKLPACHDDGWTNQLVLESVADELVLGREQQQSSSSSSLWRERVFPFLFNFGASTRLLCFVQNAHFLPESGSAATNASLDSIVKAVMAFQTGPGHREHKPRYYDFEKKRWIQLKKWKGSKEPPAL